MNYAEETRAAGRHVFPDLARAFALIGIALVNVGLFAWPSMTGYAGGGLSTPLDEAAYFGVNALFLMKSYTLFSFMFGVGFAYQIASAQRAGAQFAGRYWRRIIGLFFFAAINITFLFQGDILFIYAVLGSILFLFKDMEARSLIRWAVGLYIAQVVVLALLAGMTWLGHAFAPEEMATAAADMAERGAAQLAIYGEGSYWQTVATRLAEWSEFVPAMLFFQGIGAMSFFLFGLAAVKNGVIADPSAKFWQRARYVFLPIGLVGSAFGAWVVSLGHSMVDWEMMTGMALISLFSPFSTAGYLGLIAKWSQGSAGPVRTFLARGGTSSLTAYLLQGLLFTLIFYGYAFGYYAELGAATAIAVAFAVAIASLIFTSLWRLFFLRGPMEMILRGFTYLGERRGNLEPTR